MGKFKKYMTESSENANTEEYREYKWDEFKRIVSEQIPEFVHPKLQVKFNIDEKYSFKVMYDGDSDGLDMGLKEPYFIKLNSSPANKIKSLGLKYSPTLNSLGMKILKIRNDSFYISGNVSKIFDIDEYFVYEGNAADRFKPEHMASDIAILANSVVSKFDANFSVDQLQSDLQSYIQQDKA